MKFTIPKGRYCGACKFYYFDFAVCTLFRRQLWASSLTPEKKVRCIPCVDRFSRGATVEIKGKERE